MSYDEGRLDTAAVIDDDLLLGAIAAGEIVDDCGIGGLLSAWRVELDSAVPPIAATDIAPARRRRDPRRGLAAAAAVALVTGGSVAAAAASGPTGPLGGLHRILFGGTATMHVDAAHVRTLLDDASRRIASARVAGFIRSNARGAVADLLDNAANQLHEATGGESLRPRLAALRARLADLPETPAAAATGPPPQHTAQPGEPGRSGTAPGHTKGDHDPARGNNGRSHEHGHRGHRHAGHRPPGQGAHRHGGGADHPFGNGSEDSGDRDSDAN